MSRLRRDDVRDHDEEQRRIERDAEYTTMLALLQSALPRQAIDDQRYWAWKAKVDAFLRRMSP